MIKLTRDELRQVMRTEFGTDYVMVYKDPHLKLDYYITSSSNLPSETGQILLDLGNKILGGLK